MKLRLLRQVPTAIALVAALLHLLNVSGLFVTDAVGALLEGRISGWPSPMPTKAPGWVLQLDVLQLLAPPAARMLVLVVVQQAATVAVVVLIRRTIELAGRPRAAIVAATLTALYLPLFHFAQTIQSEAMYVFWMSAGVYFGVAAWRRRGRGDALLAGMFAGLAMAQRTVGVAMLGTFVLATLLGRTPRRWRTLAGFALGAALVIGAFTARNWRYHGYPELSAGIGIHLFGRVALIDQWLPDTEEARRLEAVAAARGRDSVFFPEAGWWLKGALAEEGMAPREADALLREVSMQVLLSDPWRTLQGCWRSICMAVGRERPRDYLLWGGLRPERFEAHTDLVRRYLKNPDRVERALAAFPPYRGRPVAGNWVYGFLAGWGDATRFLARGTWVLPLVFAIAVLGLLRRDAVLLLFSALAMAQILAVSLGDAPQKRYWDPSVPFFLSSVAIAAGSFGAWCRGRLERARK